MFGEALVRLLAGCSKPTAGKEMHLCSLIVTGEAPCSVSWVALIMRNLSSGKKGAGCLRFDLAGFCRAAASNPKLPFPLPV